MGREEHSQALHLQAAFADFELASTKLAAFYEKLEAQVAQLTMSCVRRAPRNRNNYAKKRSSRAD